MATLQELIDTATFDLNNQLASLTSQQQQAEQIRQQNATTRTVRIEKSNCITIGSAYSARSSSGLTCREVPIIETLFRQEDEQTLQDINLEISKIKNKIQTTIEGITKSFTDQDEHISQTLPNNEALKPNATSIAIPSIIVLVGIGVLLFIGRKN